MDDCVFCKIVKNKLPSFKVYENTGYLAVMDKYPVISGQVLIISKEHHTPGFSQMSQEAAGGLIQTAKKVSTMMVKGLPCREVTFMIEGLEVDHAHAKVFPVYSPKEYIRQIGQPGKTAEDELLEINAFNIRKGE